MSNKISIKINKFKYSILILGVILGLIWFRGFVDLNFVNAGTCTSDDDCGWASCGGSCGGASCPGSVESCNDHDGDPDTPNICESDCGNYDCKVEYCSGGGGSCTPCGDCGCTPPGTSGFSWDGGSNVISFDGDLLNWGQPGTWGVDTGKGEGTCSGCDTCDVNTKYYTLRDESNTDITDICDNAANDKLDAASVDNSYCEIADLDGSGLRNTIQDIRVIAHNGCCNTSTARENTIVVSAAATVCDLNDCQATEDSSNGYVRRCSKLNDAGSLDYCKLQTDDFALMTVSINGSMIGSYTVDNALSYGANLNPGGFEDHVFTYVGEGLQDGDKIDIKLVNDHEYPAIDRNLFIEGVIIDGVDTYSYTDSELILCDLGSDDCQVDFDDDHPIECMNAASDYCPTVDAGFCVPDLNTGISCTPDTTGCQSTFDTSSGYACYDSSSGDFCQYCVPSDDCQATEDPISGYTCKDSLDNYCTEATNNTCINMVTVDSTGEFCEEQDGGFILAWQNAIRRYTLGADYLGTEIAVDNPCPEITRTFEFNDYPQCSLTSSAVSNSDTPRFSNDNSSDPPDFSVSHLGEVDLTATTSDPDGDTVMVNGWELNTPNSASFDENRFIDSEQMNVRGVGWDLYSNDTKLLESYIQQRNNDVVQYRWCDFDNTNETVSNCTEFVQHSLGTGVRYRDVAIDVYERENGTTRFFQSFLHDDKETIEYRDCPFDPTGGTVSGQTVGTADCSDVTLESINLANLCDLDESDICIESLLDISGNNAGLGHMIYEDDDGYKIHLGTLDYIDYTSSETNGAVCEFDRANGDFNKDGSGNVSCDLVNGGDIGNKIGFGMSNYEIFGAVGMYDRYAQSFVIPTIKAKIYRCAFDPSSNSASNCVDQGDSLVGGILGLTNRFYGDNVNVAASGSVITTTVTDEHGLSNTCTMEYETTDASPTLVSISPDDEWSGTLPDDDNHPDTSVCTDKNPQVFTLTVEDLDGAEDITRTALWMDDEVVHVSNLGSVARGTIMRGVVLELWASGESNPQVEIYIDENSDGSFTLNEKTYGGIVYNNDWSADDSNYNNLKRSVYPEAISADQVQIKVVNAGTLHIEKLELNGVDISPDSSTLAGAGSTTSFSSSTVYGSNNFTLYGTNYDSGEVATCGVDGIDTGDDCWRNYDTIPDNGVDEVGTDPSFPEICSGSTLTATDDRTDCGSTDYGSGFAVTDIRDYDDDSDGVNERMEVDYKFWFNEHATDSLDIGTNLDIYGLVDDQPGLRDGWSDIGDWNLDFDSPTISLDSEAKSKREISVDWSSDDGSDMSGVLTSILYGSFIPDDILSGGTGSHSGSYDVDGDFITGSVTGNTLGNNTFEDLIDVDGDQETFREEVIDISGVEDAGQFEFQLESVDNACNYTEEDNVSVILGEPWLITQGGFLHSGDDIKIPVPGLTPLSNDIVGLSGYDRGKAQITTELGTSGSAVLENIIERTDATYEVFNARTVINYSDANQDGDEGVYSYDNLLNMAKAMYTYDDSIFHKEIVGNSYEISLGSDLNIGSKDWDGDVNKCPASEICWIEFSGGVDITGSEKLKCNRKTVVFVDGDLTVESKIEKVGGLNGCIFVVSGDVVFDYNTDTPGLGYDEMDGFFISDGIIKIEDDDSDEPNVLIINGGIIGYGGSGDSSVGYHRDLGLLDNIESPSLVINHDLRYTIIAGEIFKKGEDSEVYKKNEGFKPY